MYCGAKSKLPTHPSTAKDVMWGDGGSKEGSISYCQCRSLPSEYSLTSSEHFVERDLSAILLRQPWLAHYPAHHCIGELTPCIASGINAPSQTLSPCPPVVARAPRPPTRRAGVRRGLALQEMQCQGSTRIREPNAQDSASIAPSRSHGIANARIANTLFSLSPAHPRVARCTQLWPEIHEARRET